MQRRQLYCAVSLLALCGSVGIANAQQAAGSSGPGATTTAAPAEAKTGEVEEVVVTANRRAENIQDVPITVDAVSGDQLATAGITNIQDLKNVVPGLDVGNAVGFQIAHLRGVGSTTIAPGVENEIAIYVDGVYQASTESGFLDFIDVDNVQVLKGPQGTLFGRNATGGLIQVTTKEPTQDLHIDAEATYGNYDAGKGSVYISDGLTDTLAADLAVQAGGQGDGYGTNLLTGNAANKEDLSLQARSKWVWTPDTDTKITFEADFNKQRNDFNGGRLPPGATNIAYPVQVDGKTVYIQTPTPDYGSAWNINENINPLFENEGGGGLVNAQEDLGFGVLTNLIAFREDHASTHWGLYQSESPFFDAFDETQERQLSEEVSLASERDSPVTWTGGLYYFNYNSGYLPNHAQWGPAAPNLEIIPGIAQVVAPTVQEAQSFAAYGQATAQVLPATDFTLGLRYTYEKHDLHGDQLLINNAGAVAVTTAFPGESKTFEKPTIRLALDHHLDEDTMVYVSYNTGFKSGGYNTGSISDPPFQPESLTAYEVGVKSDLFERHLQLDLAAFHYDYTNIQVQKIESGNTGIINAGTAQDDGLDLDFTAHVIENLTISGSAEYVDARYTSFSGAPISSSDLGAVPGTPAAAVLPGSATGNDLPYAPRFSETLGANYVIPVADWSEFDLNMTWTHSGSFYLEADNVMEQQAFNKVSASVEWQPTSGEYSITAWGRNLTNAAVFTYGGTLTSGLHTVTYEAPRTYGATLAYHFQAAAPPPPPAPLPPPPVQAPPTQVQQPEKQREFQVFFDFDKSNITAAAANVIKAAADVVKAGGVAHITVTGHTDTVGTAKYNQALSERRAASVKSQLVTDGVDTGTISTVGAGKSGLLVPTADGVREPQNRRAVIELQ